MADRSHDAGVQISSRDGPANQSRPGPVYDTAMRRMFKSDPSDGLVTGHDRLQHNGFALALGLIYIRDLDPDKLLDDSTLAPLAVLARGDPDTRADSLVKAIDVIDDQGGARSYELFEFAARMAIIRLDRSIVEKFLRR